MAQQESYRDYMLRRMRKEDSKMATDEIESVVPNEITDEIESVVPNEITDEIEIDELFQRMDSLDYKLWEILKVVRAYAEKDNVVVEKDNVVVEKDNVAERRRYT